MGMTSQVIMKTLVLVFGCVLSLAAVAAAAKEGTAGQTPERQLVGEAEEADFLSKEELLGEDYGTPSALTQVRAQINSHLEAIAGLCQHQSLAMPLEQLEKNLSALQAIIPPNLEKRHVSISDAGCLRRVYHSLAQEGIVTSGLAGFTLEDKLTVGSFEEVPVDLAGNFLHHYLVRYNLDDRNGFYRKWEEDLYKGLTCVKPPPPKIKL